MNTLSMIEKIDRAKECIEKNPIHGSFVDEVREAENIGLGEYVPESYYTGWKVLVIRYFDQGE